LGSWCHCSSHYLLISSMYLCTSFSKKQPVNIRKPLGDANATGFVNFLYHFFQYRTKPNSGQEPYSRTHMSRSQHSPDRALEVKKQQLQGCVWAERASSSPRSRSGGGLRLCGCAHKCWTETPATQRTEGAALRAARTTHGGICGGGAHGGVCGGGAHGGRRGGGRRAGTELAHGGRRGSGRRAGRELAHGGRRGGGRRAGDVGGARREILRGDNWG
jgi:hypothetical protein